MIKGIGTNNSYTDTRDGIEITAAGLGGRAKKAAKRRFLTPVDKGRIADLGTRCIISGGEVLEIDALNHEINLEKEK